MTGAVAPKMVCVRPSTRTWTRTAAADGTTTSATTRAADNLRSTESSFREGFELRRPAGLLTWGALPCRLPSPQASGVRRGSVSPHSGGTVPDLHRRSPTARLVWTGPYHRGVTTSRGLTYWLPVLLWAGVIFALSSVPSLGTGLGAWDTILRKGAHVTEYA